LRLALPLREHGCHGHPDQSHENTPGCADSSAQSDIEGAYHLWLHWLGFRVLGLIDHPRDDSSAFVAWGNGQMTVAGRAGETGEPRLQRFASLTATARTLTASLTSFLGLQRSQNDNHPGYREPGPAAELDCLRHILAPALLAAAKQRSEDIGIGADRVLIQWGSSAKKPISNTLPPIPG
jgi:hypothetical protein